MTKAALLALAWPTVRLDAVAEAYSTPKIGVFFNILTNLSLSTTPNEN